MLAELSTSQMEKIIREAIASSGNKDEAYTKATEKISREMKKQWWEKLHGCESSVPWLADVIDRDALDVRVQNDAESAVMSLFYELWETEL